MCLILFLCKILLYDINHVILCENINRNVTKLTTKIKIMLNTGFDKSKNTLSILRKIGFMQLVDDDGADNGFAIADLIATGSATIAAAISNGDASKRLYPINYSAENTNMMLPEIIKETAMGGNVYKVMDKTRASETYFFQVDFEFAKILKSMEESGTQIGFVYFDSFDSLVGKKDAATGLQFQPIPIANLFVDEIAFPTDSATNKIKISFSIDVFAKELLCVIPSTSHGFQLTKWKGLFDYTATYVSVAGTLASATALTIDLKKTYSESPLRGVQWASGTHEDFSIALLSAGVETPYTITAFSESASIPGRYTITATFTSIASATMVIRINDEASALTPKPAIAYITTEPVTLTIPAA